MHVWKAGLQGVLGMGGTTGLRTSYPNREARPMTGEQCWLGHDISLRDWAGIAACKDGCALPTQCECAPDAARRPVERERLHHAVTSWPPCAVCTYALSRLYAARAWRWRRPLASPPARRVPARSRRWGGRHGLPAAKRKRSRTLYYTRPHFPTRSLPHTLR